MNLSLQNYLHHKSNSFLRVIQIRLNNNSMGRSAIKCLLIVIALFCFSHEASSQTTVLDTLNNGTLVSQIKTLTYRTRTYDNYRAIREDYYQLFTKNSLDSLNLEKDKNNSLRLTVAELNKSVDSLKSVVSSTNSQLLEATNMRDSIKFFGIPINKNLYNTILWTIIIALLVALISGFIAYKRSLSITKETKKKHSDLSEEFDAYKQKVRIEREKTNVEHFREIQKLKGLNK